MSQIPTYRPAPNTIASATTMNNLYSGVGTATSSLDDKNVRSQAVDIAQVETVSNNDVGRVTRYVGAYDDTSSFTVNDGATVTVAEWDMGNGAEFDVGHMARLYVTMQADAISVGTGQYPGASVEERATQAQEQQILSGAGWIFWLEWDVTDNTLTNWAPVPGQEDFGNHISGITDNAGDPVPHIRTAYTAGTMLIPHVYGSVSSAGSNPGRILNPISGEFSNPIRRTRSYHHARSGTNTRIYGIRLRGRGVVSLGTDPAGTGDGIFYVRDTVLWTGGGATWNDYAFTNESITVDNVSFRLLVQVPQ
jgi:hypothetical protein